MRWCSPEMNVLMESQCCRDEAELPAAADGLVVLLPSPVPWAHFGASQGNSGHCLLLSSITDHRITEWHGLEGTSRVMKLHSPCHRQGHQPPHLIPAQAAQGPSNLALSTSSKPKDGIREKETKDTFVVVGICIGKTFFLVPSHMASSGTCEEPSDLYSL